MSLRITAGTEAVPAPVAITGPDVWRDPITVFTCGCFDILHHGHADFLKRARALGDRLVVGLNSDASVRLLKGPSRPFCSWSERSELLSHLRWVDEVIEFKQPDPCELIRQIRPQVVVKGPGYSDALESMPESAVAREIGARVVILDGPKISSSEIVSRIRRF